ncbi:hypothetical protein GCM10023310_16170 [Paenibacillus vulneris]|uniref:Type 1 glutamine amidotransferase n=1 Tax=Paenibacillus vulneris TaxID=1133364 RepID=A0ABW3UL49_9BACL
MRMLLLKHFDFDDPSYFISWAGQHEAELTILFPPNGFHAPAMDSFDLMIILGGPMSAYQDNEYPWLQSEKAFIREAVESGRKVLGICLGAQMLAEVLGGRVYRSPHKEIGWHQVKRNGTQHPLLEGVPDDFYSFHWHGDCFDIPPGGGFTGFVGSMQASGVYLWRTRSWSSIPSGNDGRLHDDDAGEMAA